MEDNSIPGFRFYPTEEELISFYLHNKLDGQREELNRVINRVIPLLDIYEFNPWDLPQYSGVPCQGDPEQCFFFIPRQESEARGGRPSRLTESGYWKATGSPSYVYSSQNRVIGLKRTMVFYRGRAPHGTKTQWKMNEYKAIQGEPISGATPMLRQEFSLCRVYKKTKCLRAFDRRPTRDEIITFNPTIHDHHDNYQQAHDGHDHHQYHQHEASTTSTRLSRSPPPHPPPPPPPPPPLAELAVMERTSSLEETSTSSGGGGSTGGQPSQSGESEYLNLQTRADDEALWDWEDINFFYN